MTVGGVKVMVYLDKTKKCHPIAGGMPDLIQTEHASSSRVARPNKKNHKIQNRKRKLHG